MVGTRIASRSMRAKKRQRYQRKQPSSMCDFGIRKIKKVVISSSEGLDSRTKTKINFFCSFSLTLLISSLCSSPICLHFLLLILSLFYLFFNLSLFHSFPFFPPVSQQPTPHSLTHSRTHSLIHSHLFFSFHICSSLSSCPLSFTFSTPPLFTPSPLHSPTQNK